MVGGQSSKKRQLLEAAREGNLAVVFSIISKIGTSVSDKVRFTWHESVRSTSLSALQRRNACAGRDDPAHDRCCARRYCASVLVLEARMCCERDGQGTSTSCWANHDRFSLMSCCSGAPMRSFMRAKVDISILYTFSCAGEWTTERKTRSVTSLVVPGRPVILCLLAYLCFSTERRPCISPGHVVIRNWRRCW